MERSKININYDPIEDTEEYKQATVEELLDKIEEFKSKGCKLFL